MARFLLNLHIFDIIFTALFFNRTLQKKALSQIKVEREVVFMPMDKVCSVGFIYDIGDDKTSRAVKYLTDYLNERKIEYKGLAINMNVGKYPDTVGDFKIKMLSKNNLSRVGIPEPGLIEKIISEKIDLFIDFCAAYNFTHDYIACLSRAHFKVGHFDSDNHPFDLVIGTTGVEDSPVDYVKNVIHYLTSIKSSR